MLTLLVSSASAGVLRHDFDNLDLEDWVISEGPPDSSYWKW